MATTIITTGYDPEEFKSLIANCIFFSIKEELKSLSLAPAPNNILTRLETAKLLGISLPTLNDYTKHGLIKAHRLGSKVRYKREDVVAGLKQIKTGTP